jgi:hypothetical protein
VCVCCVCERERDRERERERERDLAKPAKGCGSGQQSASGLATRQVLGPCMVTAALQLACPPSLLYLRFLACFVVVEVYLSVAFFWHFG